MTAEAGKRPETHDAEATYTTQMETHELTVALNHNYWGNSYEVVLSLVSNHPFYVSRPITQTSNPV
jgi:hypothetical protein